MSATDCLWHSDNEQDWKVARERYWDFVKPSHLELERELDSIDAADVENMDADQWYDFLLNKYFFWKYTAKNRYVTTTMQLKRYLGPDDSLQNLLLIKQRLFKFDRENATEGLSIARDIRGLGTAGASGLLAVLFPSFFATVGQFAVKALSEVRNLPENSEISRINPNQIGLAEGALLINIMKRKARELNNAFATDYWTPRKIDMVLWVSSR